MCGFIVDLVTPNSYFSYTPVSYSLRTQVLGRHSLSRRATHIAVQSDREWLLSNTEVGIWHTPYQSQMSGH